jgi:hypothetical protein
MTIRTPSIAAVIALLGFATNNPVSAQPLAPNRPPSNAFGGLFVPGSTVLPNAGTTINGLPRAGAGGAFGPGTVLGPGFGNQQYYGPWAPYILAMQPVVFNNRGHWFSNYYGHWYPNGVTNGVGVISNGGTTAGYRLGANQMIGSGAFGVPNMALPGLPGGGAGAMPGGGMPGGLVMPGAMPGINR